VCKFQGIPINKTIITINQYVIRTQRTLRTLHDSARVQAEMGSSHAVDVSQIHNTLINNDDNVNVDGNGDGDVDVKDDGDSDVDVDGGDAFANVHEKGDGNSNDKPKLPPHPPHGAVMKTIVKHGVVCFSYE
jgi:hypothetical protein